MLLVMPILGMLLLTPGPVALEQETKELERLQKLIWKLESGDVEQRNLAEQELIDLGAPAIDLLKRAGLGASKEVQARLDRILRWVSPDWMIDPTATAKSWHEASLRRQDPHFQFRSLVDITWQETEMAPVRRLFRLYEYQATFQGRSHGRRILVNRGGDCTLWTGQLQDVRHLLDVCRLRALGEKDIDQIGRICRIIRGAPPYTTGYDQNPNFLVESQRLEPERIEIKDREFIYHEHSLVLFGGRAGFYEEDLVYHFGEDGGLETINITGFPPNLTVRQREDLLAEADPWLRLWGFVDVETRNDLRKRQKDKERPAPRHDRH